MPSDEETKTASQQAEAPGSGGTGQRTKPGRYGLLLLVLIVGYLLSAFIGATWITIVQLALFITAGALALRSSPYRRKTIQLIAAGALAGSAVMIVAAVLYGGNHGYGIAAIWAAILLLLTVVVIVRQILSLPVVTLQSIFGALSAYLMIGLMFSACYSAMYRLGGDQFFAHGQVTGSQNITPIFQYFSFTTLTTLGYGDFTAASNGGRAVAMLEAITGQIFLATLVARLVAAFRAPAERSAGPAAGGSGG